MTIIDGKSVAAEMKNNLKERVASFRKSHGFAPVLRLVSVGADSAAESYIRSKMKYGEKLGVSVELASLDSGSTQEQVADALKKYSADGETHGIVLEAPLPKGLSHTDIAQNISPLKDVDCITAMNQGRIALNRENLLPATAEAIRTLIEMQDPPEGAVVTIINRSPVIGRPLSNMLLNRNFTVNVCHSRTRDIAAIARQSDIIVVGVGRAGFLTEKYVTEKSIVVDAGINYANGKLTGDADYEGIHDKVKAITPVPGGVGPVTTAVMFRNLMDAAEEQMKNFGD